MKKFLLWTIPAIVLLALVVWRFSTRSAEKAGSGGGPAAAGRPSGGGAGGGGAAGGGRGGGSVETAVASTRTIVDGIRAVGEVQSPRKVLLSPRSSARILSLDVRPGDQVEPGQVLVRLDPADLQAAVYQQQANVAEARSRLAQAKLNQGPTEVGVSSAIRQQQAALNSAQADFTQTRRNYESQVAGSQGQVADAKAKVDSAQAQVRNAQANVQQQQANASNVQTRYNRTFELYKQGFIAAQDVDDARTAVNVAEAALDVARGQLSAAQSAQASAEAQLKTAESNAAVVRRKGLADIEASRARVAQARAALDVASANRAQTPAFQQNVAALQSSVDAAVAQLRQAQARLADTTLKSPISGTITARNADAGSLASPGQPVLEIQFLDWVYVSTSIPIDQVAQVRQGQAAQIKFDALPEQTFVGAITNVNAAADQQNRQVSILIRVANTRRLIKPGMYAQVTLETRRLDDAVVVPREAITTQNGRSTIALVDKDGTAKVVPVKLGASDDKGVQILEGVRPGDRVVVLTYSPIRDGQKVETAGEGGRGRSRGSSTGEAPPGRGSTSGVRGVR